MITMESSLAVPIGGSSRGRKLNEFHLESELKSISRSKLAKSGQTINGKRSLTSMDHERQSGNRRTIEQVVVGEELLGLNNLKINDDYDHHQAAPADGRAFSKCITWSNTGGQQAARGSLVSRSEGAWRKAAAAEEGPMLTSPNLNQQVGQGAYKGAKGEEALLLAGGQHHFGHSGGGAASGALGSTAAALAQPIAEHYGPGYGGLAGEPAGFAFGYGQQVALVSPSNYPLDPAADFAAYHQQPGADFCAGQDHYHDGYHDHLQLGQQQQHGQERQQAPPEATLELLELGGSSAGGHCKEEDSYALHQPDSIQLANLDRQQPGKQLYQEGVIRASSFARDHQPEGAFYQHSADSGHLSSLLNSSNASSVHSEQLPGVSFSLLAGSSAGQPFAEYQQPASYANGYAPPAGCFAEQSCASVAARSSLQTGSDHHQQEQQQLQQHHEPDLKVCEWEDCEGTFMDMALFVKHLEEEHVNRSPRVKNRYFCLWSKCKRNEQEFNARYKLLIHMRVHSGEKPYPCNNENCKKSFSRLENLKIHVRSHTGEKPYKCNYDGCNKSFTNSSDRIKHHKTHRDPKPYACSYAGCSKRYTDPSSLRKHLRAHKRASGAAGGEQLELLQSAGQQQRRQSAHEERLHQPAGSYPNADGFLQAKLPVPVERVQAAERAQAADRASYFEPGRIVQADYDPMRILEEGYAERQEERQQRTQPNRWPSDSNSYANSSQDSYYSPQSSQLQLRQQHEHLSRSWCAGAPARHYNPQPAYQRDWRPAEQPPPHSLGPNQSQSHNQPESQPQPPESWSDRQLQHSALMRSLPVTASSLNNFRPAQRPNET